jgi:hypothetical protein
MLCQALIIHLTLITTNTENGINLISVVQLAAYVLLSIWPPHNESYWFTAWMLALFV